MSLLFIILMIFLLQDNVIILFILKQLKVYLVSHDLSYVLKHKQDTFFLVVLFFSDFFQSSPFNGKFICSQLFIYKKFNFCYSLHIYFYFFMIYHDCYSILKTFVIFLLTESIVPFLFFIKSGESTCDPP